MKATRSNLGYLIAAAGGLLLFISEFLSWFSLPGGSANLWDIFSGVDILLALIGLATAVLAASYAMGNPLLAVPPTLLQGLALVAFAFVLEYVLESDNAGYGSFIGLLATVAMVAGAVLTARPDLAGRVADAAGIDADRPAPPPPPGLGASAGGAPATAGGAGAAAPASAPQPSVGAGAAPAAATPAAASPGGPGAAAPAGGSGPAGESAGPPAGWYPDPQGQARLRYWDGSAWTEQTSA